MTWSLESIWDCVNSVIACFEVILPAVLEVDGNLQKNPEAARIIK